MDEYIKRGWIAEKDTVNVPTQDEYKGAVTKTVEYAYDDYAVALVAKELGDKENYDVLMKRANNYKTLFVVYHVVRQEMIQRTEDGGAGYRFLAW